MSPFLHAVPIFAVLIGLEFAFAHWKKRDLFEFEDSVRNISCGVIEELVAVLARFATAGFYLFLFKYAALFKMKPNLFTWLVALIGVDFCYYWFHRASHRVGILWAMHSVHHQSEFYNLTVALRQSALGGFFSWVFYLPLAILGVPPALVAASYALNLLYQFWIHTEAIKTMGWFETHFNTPSHHRVHHGRNAQYIDRNYAGALICWDKWFGTFTPERETVDYGVVSRLRSENPVWANWEGWVLLREKASRARTPSQKLYAWVAPPEWEPKARFKKAAAARPLEPLDRHQRIYVAFHFSFVFWLGIGYFLIGHELTAAQSVVFAAWLIVSFGSLGAMMNGAPWAKKAERLRYVLLVVLAIWFFRS